MLCWSSQGGGGNWNPDASMLHVHPAIRNKPNSGENARLSFCIASGERRAILRPARGHDEGFRSFTAHRRIHASRSKSESGALIPVPPSDWPDLLECPNRSRLRTNRSLQLGLLLSSQGSWRLDLPPDFAIEGTNLSRTSLARRGYHRIWQKLSRPVVHASDPEIV